MFGILPLMNFLERNVYVSPTSGDFGVPLVGERLYQLLDSGTLSKREIGAIVRTRYAESAAVLDAQYQEVSLACQHQPDAIQSAILKELIGKIGAFNYIRGMEVIRADGSVDREIAPRIMLSPSAAVQVLETTYIKGADRILELFCGGGYTSFFLALEQPEVLDCLDLYTKSAYDLDLTFQRAYDWIYEEVPDHLKPAFTRPNFIHGDSQKLTDLIDRQTLRGNYSKVFLHPPYGRESVRLSMLNELTELEAFVLWVNTLRHVRDVNPVPHTSYSVVPSEWADTAQEAKDAASDVDTTGVLLSKLHENPYYQGRSNVLTPPTNTLTIVNNLDLKPFNGACYIPLRETRMFDLSLVVIQNQ